MHPTTWKRSEGRLAAIFGTTRRPLSGGNDKRGRDDSLHPVLFLECKHRKQHALYSLYRMVLTHARKEGRTPVIGLQQKGSPGMLLVVHSDDMSAVVREWLIANPAAAIPIVDAVLAHPSRGPFNTAAYEQPRASMRMQGTTRTPRANPGRSKPPTPLRRRQHADTDTES